MAETNVNARIAVEVMGWKPLLVIQGTATAYQNCDGEAQLSPDFEHSLDACALAEAEIKRRGLQQQYVNAIFTIVAAEPMAWQGVLTLICLTPAQRCEAMLKAIENAPQP